MATLQARLEALAQAIGADISPLTKRVIVQASATAKAWVIKRFSSGATGNLLEFQNESDAAKLYVDKDMKIWAAAPNGALASLGAVNYGSDAALAVERFWVTAGRFVFVPAGSAEMVVNGAAGTMLRFWNEGGGFSYADFTQTTLDIPGSVTFGNDSVQTTATSRAFLTADVVNNNATANTLANITGLSFPVVSGRRYNFIFTILYDAAATTTGARFSINGPAFTRLGFTATVPLITAGSAAAAQTLQSSVHNSYDAGPAVGAFSPFTSGNLVQIAGTVVPSASGTVIARFASEVSSSAITAKAGSNVEYAEV